MNRAQRRQQKKSTAAFCAPAEPTRASLLQLGLKAHQEGRLVEAENIYARVLEIDPDQPDANHLLGCIHTHFGRHQAAHDCIAQAIARKSNFAPFHNNLGNALKGLGRFNDAIASYKTAIALAPANRLAYSNLGAILDHLGRLDEAVAAFRKAIELDPVYAPAYSNLACTLGRLGRIEESAECHRKAHELDPRSAKFHSNVIFNQDLDIAVDQAAQQAERRNWNDRFILPLSGRIPTHANERSPERRLRIGYISADFCMHSACQGFAPLILERDRIGFDVYCYDESLHSDTMTDVLRDSGMVWRRTVGLSDDELARLIRNDTIDILVDLSGHTAGNRLPVFGLKPAPIQMTGIGHLAPGITTVDYRLTTEVFTPPEEAAIYPEAPIYLGTFFGFFPPPACPGASRAKMSGGPIVFGSMNRLHKLSDGVIALWSQILSVVTDARLQIKFHGLDSAENQARIRASFARQGIDSTRLTLIGGTGQREHLDAYNRVDIALDPFPQGGGISTLESLWMGVPVIGLYDHRKIVHRSIRTVCAPLGLDDWIAESEDDYLRIAVRWATQRDELAVLKAGLRDRVRQVYSRFPAEVERAYRIAWRRWCQGLPPEPIRITDGSAKAR